jgi:hypothetical protein
MAARGFRNNNPFNLKKSISPWLGKLKSTDSVFEQFKSMDYGLRAGMINMRTQITRGYNTVQSLIARHAPAMENPTSSFIQYVCRSMGASPGTVIDYKNKDQFVKFCAAVVAFENGSELDQNFIYNVYEQFKIKAG